MGTEKLGTVGIQDRKDAVVLTQLIQRCGVAVVAALGAE